MTQRSLIPELIDDLTRAEKLQIYMQRKGISFAGIGKCINAPRTTVVRLLKSDHIPPRRFAQFIQAGIPHELLPPARDIAPGPKAKKDTDDTEPNYLGQAA